MTVPAVGRGALCGPTARSLVARLTSERLTVATAESLTGGLVAAALTDVPGASLVVRGGVVAYANDVKVSVLGVDALLLADRGAIDPEVAEQMAMGVRRVLSADLGIATTGAAGPEPSDGKPVGTAYIAVAGPESRRVRALALKGGRAEIRLAVVAAALELLAEWLDIGDAQATDDA